MSTSPKLGVRPRTDTRRPGLAPYRLYLDVLQRYRMWRDDPARRSNRRHARMRREKSYEPPSRRHRAGLR